MANVYRKRVAHGWNGTFGDPFVIHGTVSGKTIITAKPMFNDHMAYTERQPMHQAAIRDSTMYAGFAEHQQVYVRRAEEMGTTAYALAVADWYGSPRVIEINVDHWTGSAGEMIRVKARDNVVVASVRIVIRDAQGQILEMGEAIQSEPASPWWDYTTQMPILLTPFPSVQAIAIDLPGNRDSFTIS